MDVLRHGYRSLRHDNHSDRRDALRANVPASVPRVSRLHAAQQTLHRRVFAESRRAQPDQLQLQVHLQVDDDDVPGVRAHRTHGVRAADIVMAAPCLRDVPRRYPFELPQHDVGRRHHVPVRRLRRHCARVVLRSRNRCPHRNVRRRMYSSCRRRSRPEAGALASREIRPQLRHRRGAGQAEQGCGGRHHQGRLVRLQVQPARPGRHAPSLPPEAPQGHSPPSRHQARAAPSDGQWCHSRRDVQDAEWRLRHDDALRGATDNFRESGSGHGGEAVVHGGEAGSNLQLDDVIRREEVLNSGRLAYVDVYVIGYSL